MLRGEALRARIADELAAIELHYVDPLHDALAEETPDA